VIGAVLATRFRAGFLITAAGALALVALNWSTFISDERAAGGIGSAGELEDRLNIIATSLWAIEQRPFVGWGIGRFVAVNTYHHQQWSWDTPWQRGFGLSSHFNELGIGAELGLVGLALWCIVLLLVMARLMRAVRVLRGPGLVGRGLVVLAMSSFVALICAGLTVDLRFLDFPCAVVMVLAGLAVGFAERAPARELLPTGAGG
jgi:O-antigen ligase